jgi:hypothetical protein
MSREKMYLGKRKESKMRKEEEDTFGTKEKQMEIKKEKEISGEVKHRDGKWNQL